MVIDTSALVAILRNEDEGSRFLDIIRRGFPRLLAAPTAVEASMIMLSRFGEEGLADLNSLLVEAEIEIAPLSPDHVAFAVDAFRRFGKGRGRAGLNMGDCFSYALASATGEALLFKGNDFVHTDVKAAT